MTGCGDCRMADGSCPHNGERCGTYGTRNIPAPEIACDHAARPGPNIESGPRWNRQRVATTETCRRCGSYRLWHLTTPGEWRKGPVPGADW